MSTELTIEQASKVYTAGKRVKLLRIIGERDTYVNVIVSGEPWYMSGVGIVIRLVGYAGAYSVEKLISL